MVTALSEAGPFLVDRPENQLYLQRYPEDSAIFGRPDRRLPHRATAA